MGSRSASSWRWRTVGARSEEEQPARRMAINKNTLITSPSALRFAFSGVFHAVIRRFLRNVNIVRMALGHARGRNSAEAGLASQCFNIRSAAIAHARAKAADHLIDKIAQRSAIRHAAFDAFGNQLLGFRHRALAVAVLGTMDHGPHATHSAIGFVSPSLIYDQLTWRF